MMENLDQIKEKLVQKSQFLSEKLIIARDRRLFAQINQEDFSLVLDYLIKELKFVILCAITGMDEVSNFSIIYHLAQENGTVLSLKVVLASRETPVINTITETFPAADIYERELVDLFGIQVTGLKEGKRYPLPDNWPQGEYPLRKGWTADRIDKNEGGVINA